MTTLCPIACAGSLPVCARLMVIVLHVDETVTARWSNFIASFALRLMLQLSAWARPEAAMASRNRIVRIEISFEIDVAGSNRQPDVDEERVVVARIAAGTIDVVHRAVEARVERVLRTNPQIGPRSTPRIVLAERVPVEFDGATLGVRRARVAIELRVGTAVVDESAERRAPCVPVPVAAIDVERLQPVA